MSESRRDRRYPRTCPVCGLAMVGERSSPDSETIDVHRCLNCGTVISEVPEESDEENEDP